MRSKRFLLSVATALVALFAVSTAYAQPTVDIEKNKSIISPESQFGFGVNNAGMHIQYAISPAFHIGLNLNLDVNSQDSLPSGSKTTSYDFGPYFKFIFGGEVVKPYAYASLGIIQPGTGRFVVTRRGISADLPETEMEIRVAAGAEYFFNRNVGLYGHVNLASLLIEDPAVTDFGLLGGVAGAEFFF